MRSCLTCTQFAGFLPQPPPPSSTCHYPRLAFCFPYVHTPAFFSYYRSTGLDFLHTPCIGDLRLVPPVPNSSLHMVLHASWVRFATVLHYYTHSTVSHMRSYSTTFSLHVIRSGFETVYHLGWIPILLPAYSQGIPTISFAFCTHHQFPHSPYLPGDSLPYHHYGFAAADWFFFSPGLPHALLCACACFAAVTHTIYTHTLPPLVLHTVGSFWFSISTFSSGCHH